MLERGIGGEGYWWGALLEESPKLVIVLRLTGHSKVFRSLLLMNLPAFISRGEFTHLFLRNFCMLINLLPTSSLLLSLDYLARRACQAVPR